MFLPFVAKEENLINRLGDIVTAGHALLTNDIFQIAVERNGVMSFGKSMSFMKDLAGNMRNNSKRIAQTKKVIEAHWTTFSAFQDLSTRDLFNHFDDLLFAVCNVCMIHGFTSNVSGISQIFAFKTLMEGEKEITSSHLADMANILKSCTENVVSAGVPNSIKNIVQSIRDSGKKESFEAVESSKMDWLKKNCPEAHEKVREFFKLYGHRAVMEFDIFTETWSMNPDKFLSIIQVWLMQETLILLQIFDSNANLFYYRRC